MEPMSFGKPRASSPNPNGEKSPEDIEWLLENAHKNCDDNLDEGFTKHSNNFDAWLNNESANYHSINDFVSSDSHVPNQIANLLPL